MPTQTDYEKVLDVFHSEIRDKYPLPEGLERCWFNTACSDYELDIAPLTFNDETGFFKSITSAGITTLGLMMAKYYSKREQSRINKLNNIVGKDLQLTGMGQSKSALKNEYDQIVYEIEQKLHKQKTHCFS